MDWKHWLSVCSSAFVGGAGGYFASHLSSGLPTTAQQFEAFGLGAGIAGVVAVLHLFQQAPTGAALPETSLAVPVAPPPEGKN